MNTSDRPEWWGWDLAFTPHVGARMEERGFSEVELRAMLEDATVVGPARRPGRYLVRTRRSGDPWIVVVEPDAEDQLLLIVTAYPREDRP
jgi:hypothetical protein